MNKTLKKDFKACEKIIKKNSKTFYSAFSKLNSENDRNAIYAIYAYCRIVDDAIDEYEDLALLKTYENKIRDLKNNKVSNDFIFRALNEVIKEYYPNNYDFEPYLSLIKGQEQDYHFTQPKTFNDLKAYSYLVAGTVGKMLAYILAPKENVEKITKVAINLGEAMQITNILRDIGEDINRNRIYLPKDLMKEKNYTEEQLRSSLVNDNFIEIIEDLITYANNKYQMAIDNLYLFKIDARKPLKLAALMYQAILDEIVNNKYQVFTTRSIVSKSRKLAIIKQVLNE